MKGKDKAFAGILFAVAGYIIVTFAMWVNSSPRVCHEVVIAPSDTLHTQHIYSYDDRLGITLWNSQDNMLVAPRHIISIRKLHTHNEHR